MIQRNRSKGWQHAKKSGHENERLLCALVSSNITIQQQLLSCAGMTHAKIESVQYGGLCETDVDCILGGKTKSKTDMWLLLSDGERLNVSIKKDPGGQVFLIGIERFIEGFELQYNQCIPQKVKEALRLYFGSSPDISNIIQAFSTVNRKLEERKHRLVAETLKAYDTGLYTCLIEWINLNIKELFDFCFVRGLTSNPSDWAQIVWYKNVIGEYNLDTMFYLPTLMKKIPASAEYGKRNGGSTIQLPFGFVQWHSPRKVIPGSIQFHHSYKKLSSLDG